MLKSILPYIWTLHNSWPRSFIQTVWDLLDAYLTHTCDKETSQYFYKQVHTLWRKGSNSIPLNFPVRSGHIAKTSFRCYLYGGLVNMSIVRYSTLIPCRLPENFQISGSQLLKEYFLRTNCFIQTHYVLYNCRHDSALEQYKIRDEITYLHWLLLLIFNF